MNGADNENNTFRPIDMNGQDLKTSSGNLGINAFSSTGTGTITLTPRTGAVVDIAGNATLTGTRQIDFGGGTNITDTINRTGLTITNNTNPADITQSIYQDANCNLTELVSPSTQYFNTNTPTTQTIRRLDTTSGNDIQKNQSTLVQTKLDYTDVPTGDTSSIRLENDLASLNNVIGAKYTTGAGAVLETILQTTPSGQHRLSMTNNNTNFSTILSTTQLLINDTTNNKNININNQPSSTENRIDLFKNDGSGINSTSGLVNNTSTQTLFLNHNANPNDKTISIENLRGGAGTISFNNAIDSNPFNITSNNALTITANTDVDITSTTTNIDITGTQNVNISANNTASGTGDGLNLSAINDITMNIGSELILNGSFIYSAINPSTSAGSLLITINGTPYKLQLYT